MNSRAIIDQAIANARVGKILKVGDQRLMYIGRFSPINSVYGHYLYIGGEISNDHNMFSDETKELLRKLNLSTNRNIVQGTLGELC
jgi:hypothetical protein